MYSLKTLQLRKSKKNSLRIFTQRHLSRGYPNNVVHMECISTNHIPHTQHAFSGTSSSLQYALDAKPEKKPITDWKRMLRACNWLHLLLGRGKFDFSTFPFGFCSSSLTFSFCWLFVAHHLRCIYISMQFESRKHVSLIIFCGGKIPQFEMMIVSVGIPLLRVIFSIVSMVSMPLIIRPNI